MQVMPPDFILGRHMNMEQDSYAHVNITFCASANRFYLRICEVAVWIMYESWEGDLLMKDVAELAHKGHSGAGDIYCKKFLNMSYDEYMWRQMERINKNKTERLAREKEERKTKKPISPDAQLALDDLLASL